MAAQTYIKIFITLHLRNPLALLGLTQHYTQITVIYVYKITNTERFVDIYCGI